jgi:hypothetical protein
MTATSTAIVGLLRLPIVGIDYEPKATGQLWLDYF